MKNTMHGLEPANSSESKSGNAAYSHHRGAPVIRRAFAESTNSLLASAFKHLGPFVVGFYPVNLDKSPAISGKLEKAATAEPGSLSYWTKYQGHRRFAAKLARNSRLLIIDTEGPFKSDSIGPDGELFFCELLEEHGFQLPPCPMFQTLTGGFHRYYLIPKGIPIRSIIALWPGVDILGCRVNVILPGSRFGAAEYRALRSFEECPIPELPRDFARFVRKAQKKHRPQRAGACRHSIPQGDVSLVSNLQWRLLSKNEGFSEFWERNPKGGDTSLSGYEYHLAKKCFCCGLSEQQTISVIQLWWGKHQLKRSHRKLRRAILPGAWREVGDWVLEWQRKKNENRESRLAAKTSRRILEHLKVAGPQFPASVATTLNIPRERVKKAVQRMAEKGAVTRTSAGYSPASTTGDISCITTPYRECKVF